MGRRHRPGSHQNMQACEEVAFLLEDECGGIDVDGIVDLVLDDDDNDGTIA